MLEAFPYGDDTLAPAPTAFQVRCWTPLAGSMLASLIWAIKLKPDSGPGAAENPAADH